MNGYWSVWAVGMIFIFLGLMAWFFDPEYYICAYETKFHSFGKSLIMFGIFTVWMAVPFGWIVNQVVKYIDLRKMDKRL